MDYSSIAVSSGEQSNILASASDLLILILMISRGHWGILVSNKLWLSSLNKIEIDLQKLSNSDFFFHYISDIKYLQFTRKRPSFSFTNSIQWKISRNKDIFCLCILLIKQKRNSKLHSQYARLLSSRNYSLKKHHTPLYFRAGIILRFSTLRQLGFDL